MFKKKCHNCGVIDSIHVRDEGSSKLVSAFGPKDDDSLQMYFIYCRSCQFINIYKPGWFGNNKFDSYMDVREIYAAYQNGQMTRQEMGFIAGKIQRAMIDDGVLPKDWKTGRNGKSTFTANDVENIDFGKYFYLLNYRTHYSGFADGSFLENLPDEHKCLSELFLLRGWTTQFGFRIFNSYQHLVDSILYQIVNQAKVLGIEAFRIAHGFSPEEALGDDFMSLLESRWQEYDREVVSVAKERIIPALEIAGKTLDHCSVFDPIKTYNLSLNILAQLDQIKQEAIQLSLINAQ